MFIGIFVAIFSVSMLVAQDAAEPADSAPPAMLTPAPIAQPRASTLRSCERIQNSQMCVEFRKRHPDLHDNFLDCSKPTNFAANTSKLFIGCGENIKKAGMEWLKDIGSLFDGSLNESGKAFQAFQEDCFKDVTCRTQLYEQGLRSYYRRAPTLAEIANLAKAPPEHRMRIQPFYYGVVSTFRQWKEKEAELRTLGIEPDSDLGKAALLEINPYWKPELRETYQAKPLSEKARAMLDATLDQLSDFGVRLQCLDGVSAAIAFCYGAAYLVDPIAAAAMVAKVPMLAKLFLRTPRTDLKSAAEKVLGRTLSAADKELIDQAHRVGAGEVGKDGSPARLGNYTQSQLRQKYELLGSRFSAEDIRKLMENGIVGQSGRELAEQRLVKSSSTSVSTMLQEQTFKAFDAINDAATKLNQEVTKLSEKFGSDPEFRALQKASSQVENDHNSAMAAWNPESLESTKSSIQTLQNHKSKVAKLNYELKVFQLRDSARDLNMVREEPRGIMPKRVYTVKADRETQELKVAFSDRVVKDIFWETRDSTRKEASQAFVEAINRGFRDGSKGNGLSVMSVNGERLIKVQIHGAGTGAYRIYGFERQGVIHIVHWENESVHDIAYRAVVLERTKSAMQTHLRDFKN